MKYFKKFVVVGVFASLFCLMFPAVSYAYLDPGTGSYFIQFLIAFFLGCLVMIKLFWLKIKGFVLNLLNYPAANCGKSTLVPPPSAKAGLNLSLKMFPRPNYCWQPEKTFSLIIQKVVLRIVLANISK